MHQPAPAQVSLNASVDLCAIDPSIALIGLGSLISLWITGRPRTVWVQTTRQSDPIGEWTGDKLELQPRTQDQRGASGTSESVKSGHNQPSAHPISA
jgi:hypothetical protein